MEDYESELLVTKGCNEAGTDGRAHVSGRAQQTDREHLRLVRARGRRQSER